MLLMQSVTKRFGSKTVLDNIDLSLESETTHVILGTSGCGKSTLLRIFMGLTPIQSGSVEFDGIQVTTAQRYEIAQRVGYVVQEGGLFPHLTAKKNLTLVAEIRGWDKARCETRIEELCELVNLPQTLLSRFPQQLSGGQRQRISLMRALMLNPSILLMDEPLGALDPITRSDLQTELRKIFQQLNKTVVIVTHDLSEAAYFGHTITLMNAGRIVQHGSIEDLVQRPSDPYVTTFLKAQRPSGFLKELTDEV